MNNLHAVEAIRDCQASANLDRRPYSICCHHKELFVLLKTKAVELGYTIIETCYPVRV